MLFELTNETPGVRLHNGHVGIYEGSNNIMKIWHYLPKALFEDCLYFARFVESEVDFNELMAVANAV